MDCAKNLLEEFCRTYCVNCKNCSELRIIKKEICVLEDMAIKPCDRPICNSKSVLITVCVSQKTHTCNYWKSILYNLAYKFYDQQLKRGRRQRGNIIQQLTPTNYLNCLKYLKYCFDNAIYTPEFEKKKKKQVIFWFIGTNFFFFLWCYFKICAIEQGSPASYQVAY